MSSSRSRRSVGPPPIPIGGGGFVGSIGATSGGGGGVTRTRTTAAPTSTSANTTIRPNIAGATSIGGFRSRSGSNASSVDLPDRVLPTDLLASSNSRSTSLAGSAYNSPTRMKHGVGGGGGGSLASSLAGSRRTSVVGGTQQPPPPPGNTLNVPNPNHAGGGGSGVANFSALNLSQLDSIIMSPPKRPTSHRHESYQPSPTPTTIQQFHQSNHPHLTYQQPQHQQQQQQPQTQVHIHQYVSPPHHHGASYLSSTMPLSPPTHQAGGIINQQQRPQPYPSLMGASIAAQQYQPQQYGPTGDLSGGRYLPSTSHYPPPTSSLHGSQLQSRAPLHSGVGGFTTSLAPTSSYRLDAYHPPTGVSEYTYNPNNDISASHAKLTDLSKSIRDAKISSSLEQYSNFQDELNKEMYVLALEHWAHKEYLRRFRSWKWVVSDRSSRLKHFQTHLAQRRKHQLFGEWIYQLHQRRRTKACMIRAVEHWAFIQIEKSFLRFRSRIRKLHRIESDIITLKLRRIFADWRLTVMLRHNASSRITLIQTRCARHRRTKMFQLWKEAIFCRINMKHILYLREQRMNRDTWHQWMTCRWYNQIEMKIRTKDVEQLKLRTYQDWRYTYLLSLIAEKHKSNKYSRILLKRWRDSTERRRHIHTLVKRAELHSLNQTMSTWRSLMYYTASSRLAEKRGDRLTLLHTLTLWILSYRFKRRSELATSIGIEHFEQYSRRKFMKVWSNYVVKRRNLKHKSQLAIGIHRYHTLSSYLIEWYRQRYERQCQRQNLQRSEEHYLLRKLEVILKGWSDVVRLKYGRGLWNRHKYKPYGTTSVRMRSSQHHITFDPDVSLNEVLRSPSSSTNGGGNGDFFSSRGSTSVPTRVTGETRLIDRAEKVFVPYQAQISMAELYHAHRMYRRALRGWSAWSAHSRQIRQRLLIHAQLMYLKHALRNWSRVSKRSKLYGKARHLTEENDRQALLVASYNSWVNTFNRSQVLRQLYEQSVRRDLERRWLRWCLAFRTRRTIQLKRQWIELHLVQRKFFLTWRERHQRHTLLQTILSSRSRRLESEVLRHWYGIFKEPLKFLKLRHRLVKMTWFRTWKRQAYLAKNLDQLVTTWQQRRPLQRTLALFQHWRQYLHWTIEAEKDSGRYRLRKIFSTWQRRQHWSQFDRRVITSFEQRRKFQTLLTTWRLWKTNLVHHRSHVLLTRRSVVHTWLRWLGLRKIQRGLVRASKQMCLEECLLRGLQQLRTHVIRRSKVRKAVQKAQHHYRIGHLETRCFTSWLKLLAEQRKFELLSNDFLESHMIKKVLNIWKMKYVWRCEARTRLLKIIPFWGRPNVNATIQLWKRYAMSHKELRNKYQRFETIVAQPIRRVYVNKLLSDALRDWKVAFAIRTRTASLGSILQRRTRHHIFERAWLDWYLHYKSGIYLNTSLKRHALDTILHHTRTKKIGRTLSRRMNSARAQLILDYWRMKTMRILKNRQAAYEFRQVHVIEQMRRQAFDIWRQSFLLLRGPLTDMLVRRNRVAASKAIEVWIETLNRRSIFRWTVQLFMQRLEAMQQRQIHREREKMVERMIDAGVVGAAGDDTPINIDGIDAGRPIIEDVELARELANASIHAMPIVTQALHPPEAILPSIPRRLNPTPAAIGDGILPSGVDVDSDLPSLLTVASLKSIVWRWKSLDLFRPFRHWFGVIARRKSKEHAWLRAVRHEQSRRAQRAFLAWSAFRMRARRARQAVEMGDRRVKQFIINRWKQFQRQEQQMTQAIQFSNASLARGAWLDWRHGYLWEVRLADGEVSSVQHWALGKLRRTFQHWHGTKVKFRELALKQRSLEMSKLYQLQYRSFAHWLSLYLLSRTRTTQFELAERHHRHGLERRMMIRWYQFKTLMKQRHTLVEQGYQHHSSMLMKSLFDHWLVRFIQKRRTKQSLKNYLHTKGLRSSKRLFQVWFELTHAVREDRRKLAEFMRSRLQRYAWATWSLAYATLRAEGRMEEEGRRYHKMVLEPNRMRAAVRFWQYETRKDRILHTNLLHAWTHVRTPKFFRAWKRYVQQKRQAWRFFRIHLMNRILHRWYSRYGETKVMRLAQKTIDGRWKLFRLTEILQSWRRYARKTTLLRDAARVLVLSRGGCTIYSHSRVLMVVPSPSTMQRLPHSIGITRDEERIRLSEGGSFGLSEVRHTDPSKNRAKKVTTRRANERERGEGFTRDAEHVWDAGVDFIRRKTTVFQTETSKSATSSSATSSSALVPRSLHSATPLPLLSTSRSLHSPDPASQSVYNHMCVAPMTFGEIRRELIQMAAAAAPTAIKTVGAGGVAIRGVKDAITSGPSSSTALVLASSIPVPVDDFDHDPMIVYPSPSLSLRAIFTFWFTSATMFRRARYEARQVRSRFVLERFRLMFEKRKEVRMKKELARQLKMRQDMRHFFLVWNSGARLQKGVDEYAKTLYWHAWKRMATRNGQRMLKHWHQHAVQGTRLKEARSQWNSSSLRYAISVWHWRSHRQRILKSAFQTLWFQHHHRILFEKFQEWRMKRVWNERFTNMSKVLKKFHGQDVLKKWYSHSLTTRVEDLLARRHAIARVGVIRFWHYHTLRKTSQAEARKVGRIFLEARSKRQLGHVFRCWGQHRIETSRIRKITTNHTRLVQHDFLIAWHEGLSLSRSLRQRDSDFERILTLRKLQKSWTIWKSVQRLRCLERCVLERRSRQHLQEWIYLMEMNRLAKRKLQTTMWKAWERYVISRRYAFSRAAQFRSFVLSRSVLRHWRFTLLTPLQKSQMVEIALHVWKSSKKRQAGLLFGHWRSLTRVRVARKMTPDVIAANKARLSSMRELTHLVSSSTVGRAHLHAQRSPSPAPATSPSALAASAQRRKPSPSPVRFAPTLTTTNPTGSFAPSPSKKPIRIPTVFSSEEDGGQYAPPHAIPPLRSSLRSSSPPVSSPRTRIGGFDLPTASRATLSSLRTFLESPPHVGLRVKKEHDTIDPIAYAPSSSIGSHSTHRRASGEVDSSSDDEVLMSPTGRHALFMQIPTAAVKATSPARPTLTQQQFDRSLSSNDL